ncbi:MAG: Nramp family divalent metal transporter [Armatimonadota bacterium]
MTKIRVRPVEAVSHIDSERLAPPSVRTTHSPWGRRLMTFLMVMGPGLIVMVSDNDAGAVSTYTEAGARFGMHLLWLLLFLLPCTYFVQEMVARLGIATGQGHAAMIYKRFGKWWGVFSLFDLLLVNFLTLITEFAAIALAVNIIGISAYIAVPLAAAGLIFLVSTASFRRWEKVTIFLCVFDMAWFILGWKYAPSAGTVIRNTLVPSIPHGGITSSLVFLVIAIVGTTIAPWQLFFQQSCVADKKLRFSDLKWERLDTFIGACAVIIVAGCMMLAGNWAATHIPGFHYEDPAKMFVAMGHLLGPFTRNIMLLLMCNAAILGATSISLSSAWAYGEVKGWPSSLELPVREAKGFYGTYAACVALAAAIVLIPRAPLQLIILSVQVLAGIMLPSAIIFLQLLLNDKELLTEKYVNKNWNNLINWTIIIILFALSLILAAQVVAPNLFPK